MKPTTAPMIARGAIAAPAPPTSSMASMPDVNGRRSITVAAAAMPTAAMALTDNVALMTAWANDTAYERLFVEQLMTYYRPGDTVVAISGSGNSPSVLRAIEWANAQGAPTIGLVGFDGGKLAPLAKLSLVAPSHFMPEVEDVHMAICHAMAVTLGERVRA